MKKTIKTIPRMVKQSLKGVAPFATGRMAELFLAHMRSDADGHTHLKSESDRILM